jgi:surface antigen
VSFKPERCESELIAPKGLRVGPGYGDAMLLNLSDMSPSCPPAAGWLKDPRPRDDNAGVTPSPQRRVVVLALLAALLAVLAPARPASAYTDDYPWRTDTSGGADAFGFTKRQCVSYAAWRLYKAGHRINNRTVRNGRTYYWGNGYHWDETAAALGKPVRTYARYGRSAPRVGSIAQWNANERSTYYVNGGVGTWTAGPYGHVAWVASVYSDGSVLVRQYNSSGSRTYSQMRVKAPRYLVL